ncbi:MAG: HAD family hydrolase [Candidatus Bathyarchaeia archaeon]
MRGIIFDLNGTLIVGEYPAWGSVLEDELNLERVGERKLDVKDLREVARGRVSFKSLICEVFKVEDVEDVIARAFAIYTSKIKLREDAKNVLGKLKKTHSLILCSDTTGVARNVVKEFGLSRYFDYMFFSCDIGFLKSEEEFWRRCLSIIQCKNPGELFVVGDSPATDVYWPKKIGMHTVLIRRGEISSPDDWVDRPKGLPDEEPEYTVEKLSDVLDVILTFSRERSSIPPHLQV